ncbi:MAG TPA: hypothetical protein VN229_01710 [Terriglobales bacterium]|nr:hypothetical protein [Terriglobales bacterium]
MRVEVEFGYSLVRAAMPKPFATWVERSFMQLREYETTTARAALALAVGAVVGTAMTFAGMVLIAAIGEWFTQEPIPWGQFFNRFSLIVIILIFGIYAIGLIAIAAPIWAFLHQRGRRQTRHALALGALAAFCVRFAMDAIPAVMFAPIGGYSAADSGGDTIIDGATTLHGWIEIFQAAVFAAAIGAIVGLVIWCVAYRGVRQ